MIFSSKTPRDLNENREGKSKELGRYSRDEGDIGGDIQLSAAPGRRFVHQREDGTWDVITEAAYAVPGDQSAFDNGTWTARTHGYGVQNQTEIMHCRDLEDVGGTEITCDYEYELVNYTTISTKRDALAVARTFIRNLREEDYN